MNKQSKDRTLIGDIGEDQLGVFDVDLSFPSAIAELPGSDGRKRGPPGQLGLLNITGDHSVPKYFQLLRTGFRICTFYVLEYDIAGHSPLVQVSCSQSLNYYI